MVQENHKNERVSAMLLRIDGTNGFRPEMMTQFPSDKALRVRLDVIGGLSAYAANLSTLVGNSALTNLDLETTKLSQALTNRNLCET
jgi:hypothetical protein